MIFIRNRIINPNEKVIQYTKEEINVRNKANGATEKVAEEVANKKTSKTSFICLNSNGFPSNRNNWHKLKAMEKLLENQDAAILIETGVNTNSKILIPNTNMEIGKENKMIAIGKE